MKKIIYKVNRNKNYTTISNRFLRDKNLSLKAKGLMTMILSFPENWDFSIQGVTLISKEGKDSVRTAIKELVNNGYCDIKSLKGKDGKFDGTEYNFYEEPHTK